MTNANKLSPEEYEVIINKIKEGTATDEERAKVEELILNAMQEVEEILDEETK